MAPRILLSKSKNSAEAYENAVRAAGGEPVSAYCPGADLSYDGLLLCGGDDVDPCRYGQENNGSKDIDPDRDAAEFALIEAYIKAGKPILGVCRGHQILNIALGGTLIQDLPAPAGLFHTYDSAKEKERAHPVHATPGSWFEETWGSMFAVNSHHHQAVDKLGAGFVPQLWSESGVVEGMVHESLPIFCVQFHPERMCLDHRREDTADGLPVFEKFLQMCGK